MNTFSRKIALRAILTIAAATLSLILYLLADRYWIRHVEIADVSAASAATATKSDAVKTTSLVSAETAVDTKQTAPVLDDWSYSANGVTIQIEQVTTGSGTNQVTYFVADVTLSNASGLQSAFADNQFGRNIIATTSEIAAQNGAIFAINGDYYGFRSDGIVIRNGILYRDVPARTGLAFYLDGTVQIYDETRTSGQELLDAGVWNTLSFGPALLMDGEIPAELTSTEVDTNFGNHSIQGNQPRTGVGILSTNHFVFVVVDGRSKGYSRGVTLPEFAAIFQELGCSEAYNIDGGGSSTMVFNGRVVNNPLGRNKERGTSDILFVAG